MGATLNVHVKNFIRRIRRSVLVTVNVNVPVKKRITLKGENMR
jgi:hypothetical protein